MTPLRAARPSLLRVVAALACIAVLLGGAHGSKGAAKRLERMRRLAEEDTVIEFTDATYSKLVLTTPRNYTVVLMYTARDPQYRCGHCGTAEAELRVVADSVARAAGSGAERSVFVGVADFPSNQQAFQTHRLQRVPVVVVHPPQSQRNRHFVELPESHKLNGFTAEGMLAGLRDHGIQVPLWKDPSERWLAAYAVGAAVAVLGHACVANPARLAFFRHKGFWMFLSWAVFAFCVGGLVSCVIRQPAWYSGQYGGQVSVFDPNGGRGSQNILEGAAVGTLLTLFAGGVIMLHNAAREGKSSHHNMVIGGLGFAVAATTLLRIALQYQGTSRWYSFRGPLPDEMQQWVSATWRAMYKAVARAF